jgi:DNA-binding response OmpR family regulator
LLVDLEMPRLSGEELLAHLRRLGLLNRMRVLVVSGSRDRLAGLSQFERISKPFDLDTLLSTALAPAAR